MKDNWMLIFRILLAIGGIGNFTSNLGAALFDVITGAALIALWYFLRKKKTVQAPQKKQASGLKQS